MNGSLIAVRPKSWRCRRGRHAMRRVKLDGNLRARDARARHTSIETLECLRCGHREQVEYFYSWSYWAEFNRRVEDDRLERIIRKATR